MCYGSLAGNLIMVSIILLRSATFLFLKALDTCGNCQRLAFTVGVSQHMHVLAVDWLACWLLAYWLVAYWLVGCLLVAVSLLVVCCWM